jgi:hypothetical protein
MKRLVALFVVLLAVSPCFAAGNWATTFVGSTEQIGVRMGYLPGTQTEIGIQANWRDGLNGNGDEGYGFGVYGTYTLVPDFEIPIKIVDWVDTKIPAKAYVGGIISTMQVSTPAGHDWDADVAGIVGIKFGGPNIWVGIEGNLPVSKDLFSDVVSAPDGVMLTIGYVF